jgi:hypothetical protein
MLIADESHRLRNLRDKRTLRDHEVRPYAANWEISGFETDWPGQGTVVAIRGRKPGQGPRRLFVGCLGRFRAESGNPPEISPYKRQDRNDLWRYGHYWGHNAKGFN